MTGALEIVRGAIFGFSKRAVLTDDTTNVIFDTTEDYRRSWPGTTTERPIEDLTTIADHIVKRQQSITMRALINADTLNVIGSALSKSVIERVDKLVEWREESTILKLLWTEQIDNLVIESMSEGKEKLRNARLFNITLKRVKIADTDAATLAGEGDNQPQEVETPQ